MGYLDTFVDSDYILHMTLIFKDATTEVLRFDKDEEVVAGLLKYVENCGIKSATLTGIGACNEVELGYFNPTLKEFRHKNFIDNREILSLTGNLATFEGKPHLHIHGSFSDNEFIATGGHVFKLVVSITCEIVLIKLSGELKRVHSEDFNLNLLS